MHEMIARLAWIDRHIVAGRNGRACAMSKSLQALF
jgi:hypothetical protein